MFTKVKMKTEYNTKKILNLLFIKKQNGFKFYD